MNLFFDAMDKVFDQCEPAQSMRLTYTDERIDAVRMGAPLTAEERSDLLVYTPCFEECSYTREELAAMNDADLMTAAMWVWADYCR